MRGFWPHETSLVTDDDRACALTQGWSFALAPPNAFYTLHEACEALSFRSAQVPGTAAGALLSLGDWDWDNPPDLDVVDVWYQTRLEGFGAHRLIFEGLATLAEAYLDDDLILRSANMFVAQSVDIRLESQHRLTLRFCALNNSPKRKGRARWRPRMIQPGELRFTRTSALGHMPGFAPPAAPVGPWRRVSLVRLDQPRLNSHCLRARLDGDDGWIDVDLAYDRAPLSAPVISCAGHSLPLEGSGPRYTGSLRLPNVEKWFPHTHGAQSLYDVAINADGCAPLVIQTGFRAVSVDRDSDLAGFRLSINGVSVFCRGAVWMPIDPISLQNNPEALAHHIALARACGVNMFRVSGVTVYETDAFYCACDAAGIMVWQDFMFANFDYPIGDPDFATEVETEARQFLARTAASPALVVFCGGNEVYQQAAMMGVSETHWRSALFEQILPGLIAEIRPDACTVVNSPSGGSLPFHSDSGIAHYYGVGAYRRPLEDARRAHVRFASECLGFANAPEARTLREDFGAAPLSHPLWSPRIPRDQGSPQDFEQVRDHYIGLLYDIDPLALKANDPDRYLDLSRAAVAETIEATIGEWRRPGSSCAGALIWFWKDLWASSGWGVLDWRGRPKSPWWAMRRAFRPIQILLSDEGINGLVLHGLNELSAPFSGSLSLQCLRDGVTSVMNAAQDVEIAGHGALSLRDCALWGAFFDTANAYRFGPPSHDITIATLRNSAGEMIAEAFHFPVGRPAAQFAPRLDVQAFRDSLGAGLRISSDIFAQSIRIEDETATPGDNWFHLAPGVLRTIRFMESDAAPSGSVTALGASPIRYSLG